MGDSGALLLGFSLAAVSVQGLLKTAATVALFFPLLVLAVPILDTGFVVARRLKYRMPITTPDKTHLHHRFVNIGFSQPRAVAYIYFWVATLAVAALGTRYIPFREDGRWRPWPTVGAAALGLLAVAASIYMVYLLEIVKLGEPTHPPPPPGGGGARADRRRVQSYPLSCDADRVPRGVAQAGVDPVRALGRLLGNSTPRPLSSS